MHVYLGNTYNVANSHHLVSHFLTIQAYLFREYLQYGEQSSPGFPFFFFLFLCLQAYLFREYLQCGEQSSPGIPFFFFFFLTIQAYLFREYLQCGEQSSPGFPFFFFFFFFYLGNTCNVANMTCFFFFFLPVWQTVPGIFFFFNYYLYDSPVQPASRSHP